MTRSLARLAAVGALVASLAGCDRALINAGASTHAAEHVAAGQPDEKVRCQIPDPLYPDDQAHDGLWDIPSRAVAAFGCEGAWRRATGTSCIAGAPACEVNAVWMGQLDGNPYQPLRATVDAPGQMP